MKWREMTREQKHEWVSAKVSQMEIMKKTLDELIEVFNQWDAGLVAANNKQDKKQAD